MSKWRKQSSTGRPVQFAMVDSADNVTPKTGLTPTVTLSKDGGAFNPASGAVSEVGNGVYSLAGNATDRNTLGTVVGRATAAGALEEKFYFEVVAVDPFDTDFGLALAALVTAIKAKTDQFAFTNAGKVDAAILAANDFAQAAADKAWSTATRTLTSAGALATDTAAAVWSYLTSAMTTQGSIGYLLLTKLGLITSGSVTVASPVVNGVDLNLVPGNAYNTSPHSHSITFGPIASPDLTNGTVKLVIIDGTTALFASVTGTVTGAGTALQYATFELTAAQTALMVRIGDEAYTHQVTVTYAADNPTQPITFIEGVVNTSKKYVA